MAFPKVMDKLVNLQWHSDKNENSRVEIHTEDRGDKPTHLGIEQEDRCQWILNRNAHEINAKEARATENLLKERQRQGAICH